MFCNKVDTVLLITVDLLVKKWWVQERREWQRYRRKWRKGKGKWRCSSKENLNYFPRPRLKTQTFLCDGHTNRLLGLSMFQNLLWVYGMAWMSVRFPGLKFCPSLPLILGVEMTNLRIQILSKQMATSMKTLWPCLWWQAHPLYDLCKTVLETHNVCIYILVTCCCNGAELNGVLRYTTFALLDGQKLLWVVKHPSDFLNKRGSCRRL